VFGALAFGFACVFVFFTVLIHKLQAVVVLYKYLSRGLEVPWYTFAEKEKEKNVLSRRLCFVICFSGDGACMLTEVGLI
jgi:hypothetical protein